MTTKDFQRKIEFYQPWLYCFELFQETVPPEYVYRISFVDVDCTTDVMFSRFPCIYMADVVTREVRSILIERYDKSSFDIDLISFKSFVNNLSPFHYDVLINDSRFINVLNFIQNGSKSCE